MKKRSDFPYYIAVVLLHFFLIQVYSQFDPTPVEKTTQKILYQGKTYYVHTVKPGHTLYSICKAYGVTQDEIVESNPGVTISPLSVGIVLKIPATEISPPTSYRTVTPITQTDTNFIYHTVQPKENTYFLHLKYNIPLEDIYRYNPGSESGLQTGQVIRIPKVQQINRTEFQTASEKSFRYTVRDGDTLFRIAQTYGLTVEDLINANENLRWGMRAGQIITIPLGTDEAGTHYLFPDSVYQVATISRLSEYQCDSLAALKRTNPVIKVAVLLPFFANENYSAEPLPGTDTLSGSGHHRAKSFKGRPAVEFYEGMLLALDSLKKTDLSVSIFVYDTETDTNKVKKILKDLDIIEPDLIIGPLDPENIRLVSVYSFERKIPLVPPLASFDTYLIKNPYLFTVIPDEEKLFETYASYIADQYYEDFIYIHKGDTISGKRSDHFKNMLSERIASRLDPDTSLFQEVILDDQLRTNLGKVLKPDRMNPVILFSNYEPEVISALSHLHFLSRDYPIKVFGFPAWQKFDNVRFDVVHELEVSLYSPFFIDYTEDPVKTFVKKCRDQLNSEPYKTTSKGNGINYTYLGYDLSMFFIQSIHTYEKNTCDCIENFKPGSLLSDYSFIRYNNQEGFINASLSIITYRKDYTVNRTRLSGK